MNEQLRGFQKQFIRGALAPGIDVAALSLARGNGKSWLAAHLLTRCLTPGDSLHVPGAEYLLCAGSIEPGMAPPTRRRGRAACPNLPSNGRGDPIDMGVTQWGHP